MTKKFSSFEKAQAAQSAVRQDFLSFCHRYAICARGGEGLDMNWHLQVMATYLQDLAAGRFHRLIMNVPPRYLKSEMCSVALVAWLLGLNPKTKILCVSYGQSLADKFGRDCLELMMSPWYKKLFPRTKISSIKHAAGDFETTEGGGRFATSPEGSMTGRGADWIIIDDPLNAKDAYSQASRDKVNEFYSGSLLSRLDNKERGVILLTMQRLHEDDLSGYLLARGGYEHLRLPAVAQQDETYPIETMGRRRLYRRAAGKALNAQREDLALLAKLRRELGEIIYSAQYQQDPLPAEGDLIKLAWLKYYKLDERPDVFDEIFQSWDTASKLSDQSDYSVCTTWGVHRRKLYLLDVFQDRVDFPALCHRARSLAKEFKPSTILIEDKASGTQLIQELRSNGMSRVKAVQPDGDKLFRMHGHTVLFENGVVLLPIEAPWLTAFVRELTSFPNGRHDDQVDSTSQAFAHFNPRTEEPGILEYYKQMMEPEISELKFLTGSHER